MGSANALINSTREWCFPRNEHSTLTATSTADSSPLIHPSYYPCLSRFDVHGVRAFSYMQHLNDEQIRLVETKPLLEFALSEHERVRRGIEIVAHDEAERARTEAELNPVATSVSAPECSNGSEPIEVDCALSIAPTTGSADPDEKRIDEGDGCLQTSADQDLPEAPSRRDFQAVSTKAICVGPDLPPTVESEMQTDVSGPPPPQGLDPGEVSRAIEAAAATALKEKKDAEAEAEARGLATGRAQGAAGVSKLLRLLHVAARFEAQEERLPTAVDFFSKVSRLCMRHHIFVGFCSVTSIESGFLTGMLRGLAAGCVGPFKT